MKRLAEKIENIMMAITFAEAGEHETAREMIRKDDRPDKTGRATPSKRTERVMRAAPPQR